MSGKTEPVASELSIYIHVPFCKKKCPYCHFASVLDTPHGRAEYVEALLCEVDISATHLGDRTIRSVYFGGGTPFLIGPDALSTILQKIGPFTHTEVEITIEANPDCIEKDSLEGYRAVGVNRLSIGAQSFNDEELQRLCRPHTSRDNIAAVEKAIETGFSNISLDLMYDLPHQTLPHFEHSLHTACRLPITHLSLYNLTIEPNTAWFRKKESLQKQMPTSDESAAMYSAAMDIARSYGFMQYEISAFAKNGFHSIHNSGYWQGREFIGFGPSAFSFIGGIRFSNTSDVSAYVDAIRKGLSPIDFKDSLSPKERLREMAAVGLRMNEGIDISLLERRYGSTDEPLRDKLNSLANEELLVFNSGRYALTERGRMVYDSIAVELI